MPLSEIKARAPLGDRQCDERSRTYTPKSCRRSCWFVLVRVCSWL